MRTEAQNEPQGGTYVRQSKILLSQAERKLLQQRNNGYFGEYAGWPAVLQSAAENVPHVTQKRRYPHAQRPSAPHAPDHRHLYPPSGGDGGTGLEGVP